MTMIDVTKHNVHGVILIKAMAKRTPSRELLSKFAPVKGEVDVVCTINGHEIDLIEALADAWERLNGEFHERVAAAADEQVTRLMDERRDQLTDAHDQYAAKVRNIIKQ